MWQCRQSKLMMWPTCGFNAFLICYSAKLILVASALLSSNCHKNMKKEIVDALLGTLFDVPDYVEP